MYSVVVYCGLYSQDFNKPVGLISQSCYLCSGSALTGTTEGCGVVWGAGEGKGEGTAC